MVVAAATTFALNGTVSKLLIQGGFDPPQLTTFRATGAFLGLLTFILVTQGPRPFKASRQELPRLIIFGLVGFFLVPMLYFVAISRLPVGIGLLFEFTAPAFVALWVRFGEHQQVRRRLWVGLGLCLAGLASVTQIWAGELSLDGLGILAGLTSAVLLAVFYVLGSKTVATRDPLSLTCWAFGVSAVAGAVVRPWWNFDAGLLLRSSDGYPDVAARPVLDHLRHDRPVPADHVLDAPPATDLGRDHRHDRGRSRQRVRLGAPQREPQPSAGHRRIHPGGGGHLG